MFTVTFIYKLFDNIDNYFGKIILRKPIQNKLLDLEIKSLVNKYREKAGYNQVESLGIIGVMENVNCSDEDCLAFDMYLDFITNDNVVYLTVGYHSYNLDVLKI